MGWGRRFRMLYIEVKHNDTQLFVCEFDKFAVDNKRFNGLSTQFEYNIKAAVYTMKAINEADDVLVLSSTDSIDFHIVNKANIKLRIYNDHQE
jgi:hypothetical protein